MEQSSRLILLLVIYLGLLNFSIGAPQENYERQYYQVATPSPMVKRPPLTRYEQGLEDYDEENPINHKQTANYPVLKEPNFSPSHLLLTVLKTIVDVVRGVNKKRIESKTSKTVNQTSVHGNPAINGTEEIVHKIDLVNSLINETNTNTNSSSSVGRGYDDIGVISYVDDHSYHDYHHHDHHMESMAPPPPPPSTEPPKMEMMKQSRYSDPWEGYYDFIITEGSFKFWSGFQLFTALLLLYSALAAIYYAKFNPIQPDYDTTYDDYFFGRSLEGSAPEPDARSASPAPGWITSLKDMGVSAYSRILDVISSPHAPNSEDHND